MLKIFILNLIFLLHEISSQNLPCNNYWKYAVGDDQSTQGLITIYPKNVPTHSLKISLSVAARLPSSYYGKLGLIKGTQSTVNDIRIGLPILYHVKFPIQNPLPKLTAIYYNNELLCSELGSNQNDGDVTRITLNHNLYSNVPVPSPVQAPQPAIFNRQEPFYQPQPERPLIVTPNLNAPNPQPISTFAPVTLKTQTTIKPQQISTFAPVIHPPQPPPTVPKKPEISLDEINSQCGLPKFKQPDAIGLVIHGNAATRGQFPWLAALHSDGFKCGGSLISKNLVVTAAHCVQEKNVEFPRKPEDCAFALGKFNLTPKPGERKDIKWSGVEEFFMHPNYDPQVPTTYDADIAIAVLQRSITFTNFILPICIWTQTSNYNDIISKQGIVAGWGLTDGTIQATETLNWLKLPIVDLSTCRKSNDEFLTTTTKRTFCAGNQDGTGPCQGDSGGGLIVKNGGKWYLRGIVSSSLYDHELLSCDTKNYAIFTDVAQFKDWIMEKVKIYG